MVLASLPPAAQSHLCVVELAEACKLFANAFYALKVSYANQFYDYCERAGIEYDHVRILANGDPMMAPFHLDVSQDGYRGFAGKCLPKDTTALYVSSKKSGSEITLLREALRYNATLLEK